MTSRRQFIQKAGLLTAIGNLPALAQGRILELDESLASRTRKELLVPADQLYLNTGSLGPSPASVIDAVTSAMRQLETNPVSENWGALGEQMETVRLKVADFIHASPDEVLLTRNTTEGLSLVGQSLVLNAGDEILTTTLEHGGGEVGLEYLVQTRGAQLKRVELPLPPDHESEILNAIEKAITPRTRLIMLSHVNTITGLVMPLGKLAAMIKGKGIYLMADGAQAPGMISVNVRELGVDAYAASGHKWLLGPKETGFLFLKKDFQEKVHPVFSLSGFNSYTKSSGTRNVATIIGLGQAIEWHKAIGVDVVAAHCLEHGKYCQEKLRQVQGISILSPSADSLSAGMVSFSVGKFTNTQVYEALRKKGITVKILPAHNAIRISCHVFVSKSDIDKFIASLKQLVA